MELTNGEIFAAKEPLANLMSQKFPVRVSYNLAKLASGLNPQLKIIDEVRNGLFKTYGKPSEGNPTQLTVPQDGEDYIKFLEEIAELFAQEVKVDIEKVKLPEKVAATCDKCHHNMDRPLEIEAIILLQLEKFIEIA